MDGRGVNELEPNRNGPRVRIGFRKIHADFLKSLFGNLGTFPSKAL